MKHINLLMLENFEDDAAKVESALTQAGIEFVCRRVDSPKTFLEALAEFKPDLILSDYELPQINALQALRLLRENKLDIPLILVTRTHGEEIAVELMKEGADDYILKSNLKRLPAAVLKVFEKKESKKNQKRWEQELEAVNHVLEQSNAELALRQKIAMSLLEDLHESKEHLEQQRQSLEEANKRLEELSAVKDEFVSTVSHEFRTPLAVIKEGVELVMDGVLGPLNTEQKDFLGTVDENIERLAHLISNVLDLSKIEAGKIYLARKKIKIRPLIDIVIQNCGLMINRRTIRVECIQDSCVFADPERVMQVLQNLFVNAIKFTKEDGIITFQLKEESGHSIISVRDNGVGISKEDLPKIFVKFSQVGEGKTSYKGTGLGLALCKQLVALHDGKITVESVKDEGSLFSFDLPCYESKAALAEYFKEEIEIANSRGKKEKIGIVVFDGTPFLRKTSAEVSAKTPATFDGLVEFIRTRLYLSTPILFVEDRWIVCFVTDTPENNIRRFALALREAIYPLVSPENRDAKAAETFFGIAMFPQDGKDISELMVKAAESIGETITLA